MSPCQWSVADNTAGSQGLVSIPPLFELPSSLFGLAIPKMLSDLVLRTFIVDKHKFEHHRAGSAAFEGLEDFQSPSSGLVGMPKECGKMRLCDKSLYKFNTSYDDGGSAVKVFRVIGPEERRLLPRN